MASQAPGTFLSANPKFNDLALANSDPANWKWDDYQRKLWRKFKEGSTGWQQFADKWRNVKDFDQEDPSGITLDDLALPTLYQDSTLMIRNCYVEAEKLVWKRALSLPRTGAIITGHPGIGNTFFIWYLLLRLLKMKQVVLLHVHGEDVLFYHDGVYLASRDASNSHLPSPRAGLFIWSLFDISLKERVPHFVLHPRCFPVQSTSPNPDLYHWLKVRGPDYIVFPLWTLEELERAARDSCEFKEFSTDLRNVIRMDNWKNPNFVSTVSNPSVVEFLEKIFPKEGPPESFDEAFDILLNGLVSRFGVIPREVFRAMFQDFKGVAKVHDSALTMSVEELQKAADGLRYAYPSVGVKDLSYYLISFNNVGTLESEEFQIDFLSPVVAEKFSKRLWEDSQVKARSMIKHFLAMPQTKALADPILSFCPLLHRQSKLQIDEQWP